MTMSANIQIPLIHNSGHIRVLTNTGNPMLQQCILMAMSTNRQIPLINNSGHTWVLTNPRNPML